jgi:hypothetical protein
MYYGFGLRRLCCDFHPKFQQIAMTDTDTGEYKRLRLSHETAAAESFYRSLHEGRPQVRVELVHGQRRDEGP